jgi:hypothetical protein
MENASLTSKMASMGSPAYVHLALLGHCVKLSPHFHLRAMVSYGSQVAHIQPRAQTVASPLGF